MVNATQKERLSMSERTLTVTKDQEWIIRKSLYSELNIREEQLEYLNRRAKDKEYGQSLIATIQNDIQEINSILRQLGYQA